MRLQLLLVVGGWLGGWWLLFAVPVLAAPGGRRSLDTSETDAHDGARPRLSVIIPARDEAASLPHLLASLVPQLAPGDELIVVDDRSTDATAALAREAGALVIEAPELPDGWTGKSWACHHGAVTATGEVLVFFDADVRLAPGALSAAVDLHRRQGGLVSVQPYHETERAYERLSALFNVVAFMGVGAGATSRAPQSSASQSSFLFLFHQRCHSSGLRSSCPESACSVVMIGAAMTSHFSRATMSRSKVSASHP